MLITATKGQDSSAISPDGSLGADSSLVVPGVIVRGALGDRIEGGASRGGNLFHSFREFSIGEGGRVYFSNPVGIETIFSRVTGGDASRILGTLGVDGGASLFLVNPQGILFGPNARLDIAGSFVGTTASQLEFGDGLIFSATNPQAVSLLNMTVTPGLRLGASAGPIESTALLQVGGELRLVAGSLDLSNQVVAGGDLTLQAQDTLRIRDSVTQPFVAAAGGSLLVQGDRSVDIFALNHPGSGLFSGGDMVLRSLNPVLGDAHYFSGGSFKIEGLNGTSSGLISPNDPVIRAIGDVFLQFYQGTSLHIFAGGSITIPDYTWIQGADPINGLVQTVNLADGSTVDINGLTEPTLDLRAGTTDVFPIGVFGPVLPLPLASIFPSSANITLGPVFFATPDSNFLTGPSTPISGQVLITNQYQPNPSLDGDIVISQNPNLANFQVLAGRALINGDFLGGGDINIHSKGDITVNGIVNADPPAFFGNQLLGNGGDITFKALGDIVLTPGSIINSIGTLGGNLSLTSGGTIEATNGGFFSFSVGNLPGQKGGDISISAQSLKLNGASIGNSVTPIEILLAGDQAPQSIATMAQANAGNISVNVTGPIVLTNRSQIRGGVEPGGMGQGGEINIRAGSLLIDQSQISSILFRQRVDANGGTIPGAQGQAGRINALVTGPTILRGTDNDGFSSGLLTLAERGSQGGAGDIALLTDSLIIQDGALITASTRSSGNSADVVIGARTIDLLNGGKIITSTTQEAPGAGNAGQAGLFATERITIEGQDVNFGDRPLPAPGTRLARIDDYRQTPAGSSDRVSDVLIVDELLGSQSGVFAYSKSDGTTGGVLLSAPSVNLGQDSLVIADAFGSADGGTVAIFSQDLQLRNGASVLARTFGAGQGGDIFVSPIKDLVSLLDPSQIGNFLIPPIDPNQPSSVLIEGVKPFTGIGFSQDDQGQPLLFTDGGFSSELSTNAEPGSTGQGGRIEIRATDVTLVDGGVLSARTQGGGRGGDIGLEVTNLNLLEGGQILTPTFTAAQAGSIEINAVGNINISGFDPNWQTRLQAIQQAYEALGLPPDAAKQEARFTVDAVNPSSGLQSTVEFETRGLPGPPADIGGDIKVTTGGDLRLDNLAQISVGTSGRGNAGDLQFDVGGAMVLDGQSTIRAVVEGGAVGNGGDIDVNARSLTLLNASQIATVLFREIRDALGNIITPGAIGEAGDIRINVQDTAFFSGFKLDATDPANLAFLASGLLAGTEKGAQGPGGNIFLTARQLDLVDRAAISAATQNASKAGNIDLNISESLNITNRGRISVAGFSTGDPGNLTIRAGTISMASTRETDGADFRSSIDGFTESGRNANLDITVTNGIIFSCCDNQISAEARNNGTGGRITLNVGLGILTRLEDNNDIVANAYAGNGGSITANVRGPVRSFRQFSNTIGRTDDSDFIASSELGIDGTVDIQSIDPDVRPSVPLTPNFVPPLNISCAIVDPKKLADWSFVVTGRGGMVASPYAARGASQILSDWVTSAALGIERIGTEPQKESEGKEIAQMGGEALDIDRWQEATAASIAAPGAVRLAGTSGTWRRDWIPCDQSDRDPLQTP